LRLRPNGRSAAERQQQVTQKTNLESSWLSALGEKRKKLPAMDSTIEAKLAAGLLPRYHPDRSMKETGTNLSRVSRPRPLGLSRGRAPSCS